MKVLVYAGFPGLRNALPTSEAEYVALRDAVKSYCF